MLKEMAVHFCTGDVVVDNGAVYVFLRKCLLTSPPQFWQFLSLLCNYFCCYSNVRVNL